MLRIPLPFTDITLLLTTRWHGLSWLGQTGCVFCCLLVPTLLVLLYRYEMRLVRPLTAGFLLALRLGVVFFLLTVVFLQPIVARTHVVELPGRVLVAIDRSDSMKVADPQLPIGDKLRLARALKLAGDLVPDKQLDDWISQYEKKAEPVWVDPNETVDPARKAELERERRGLHDQVRDRVDRLSRLGLSQRVLSTEGIDLLEKIGKKHHVELMAFNQDSWELRPDQLEEYLGPFAQAPEPTSTRKNPKDQANDQGTDLRLPLTQAVERSGKDEGRIVGLVLLSDGQHNKDPGGTSPVDKAIDMGRQEMPIYAIALGGKQAPPDVAVAWVRAPSTVFKDVDVSIEARIKVSGLGKREIIVELERPGQPALVEKIQHDGRDQYHSVRFQVKLDKVGTQGLLVKTKPVDGEIRLDNNSRPLAINVADDKARVLVVDGEARWEYHYLASALARDRTMEVKNIVFTQPRLGKIAEDELEKVGNPSLQWPTEPDALAGYDCIVLGDVSPAQLPLNERVRLEKYVSERGGTLVILAGKRYMPLAYGEIRGAVNSSTGKEETDPLLKLLPIDDPVAVRPGRGFSVTLTPQGKLAKFLEMEPTPEQSQSRWAHLPKHWWGVVGKAKPAATSLAYVQTDQVPNPDASEKEEGRSQALIVRQNYGFGRVLYVGLDSTWRWRYKTGDTYHHRFWGQVMRWAAADKPLVAGNDSIRFGTREPVYRQGEVVDLISRIGESEKPLRAEAGARIVRNLGGGKEERLASVPMRRRPAQPRVLEGRISNLPAGQYEIEMVVPEMASKLKDTLGPDGKPTKLRSAFTILPTDSEEMIELSTNWPMLEELANKSGGKVFTPDHADEIVDLLAQRTLTRERSEESRLWEEWVTLVFFLVLVSVEWIARKMAGLP